MSDFKDVAARFSGMDDPPNYPAMAQVFATLYVGEQLERIVDLLTLATKRPSTGFRAFNVRESR